MFLVSAITKDRARFLSSFFFSKKKKTVFKNCIWTKETLNKFVVISTPKRPLFYTLFMKIETRLVDGKVLCIYMHKGIINPYGSMLSSRQGAHSRNVDFLGKRDTK